MGYFNPFYHKGLKLFIEEAKASNLKGFIIPDLPFEEAQNLTFNREPMVYLYKFCSSQRSPKKRRVWRKKLFKSPKGVYILAANSGNSGEVYKRENFE